MCVSKDMWVSRNLKTKKGHDRVTIESCHMWAHMHGGWGIDVIKWHQNEKLTIMHPSRWPGQLRKLLTRH
jgi:hypothetical protein